MQVYTLAVPEYKWQERTTSVKGEPPCPRGGHVAIALGDQRHLLVYGGGNFNAGAFHSNLALLDTQTWSWTTPSVEVSPSFRCSPCSQILLNKHQRHLLVYGEGDFNAGAFHSNLALLDTQTWSWTTPSVEVSLSINSVSALFQNLSNKHQRHLLVYGGGSFHAGAFHSNLALRDTQTWSWTTPSVEVSLSFVSVFALFSDSLQKIPAPPSGVLGRQLQCGGFPQQPGPAGHPDLVLTHSQR